MTADQWLTARIHGYGNMRCVEREAVFHFALLWSLFEECLLANEGTIATYVAKVEELVRNGSITPAMFQVEWDYFQARYFQNNGFTAEFDRLDFRVGPEQTHWKPRVADAIRGRDRSDIGIVRAIFIVIWRFRNNLFHGNKWEYQLQGQLDNFTNANSVFMKTMDAANVP